MKQMIFLAVVSLLGTVGSFAVSPLWGLAVYYLFAVLRPQFIWEWSEAMGIKVGDVQWSFSVAVATLVSTALWRIGLFHPPGVIREPWYGRPLISTSHCLFLLYAFWVCLSFFFAINQQAVETAFVEYIKIFVMFICATQLLRTLNDLRVIYYIVLSAAVYAAYEINYFYFVDRFMLLASRGYGGLDNNGAALIVTMAVPMAYFAWEANKSWFRWGFLLVIPVLVHALMLSFSRGGMVALGFTAIPIWLRARNKWFLSAVYLVMGIFVLAAAGKELQERFFSISKSDADASAQSRFVTWEIAIRMANERPFFGFGIRNSNLFTKQYGADIEGRSIHSQYLQTAADCGWIGMAIYIAMLLSTLMGLWWVRWYLRRYHDTETLSVMSMAAGLECGLILFCLGAVFLSLEHFEMPYILLLLAMQLHSITRRVAARRAALDAAAPALAPPSPQSAPEPAAVGAR